MNLPERLDANKSVPPSRHESPRYAPPTGCPCCAPKTLYLSRIRRPAEHHRDLDLSAPFENFHRHFVGVPAHLEIDARPLELQIAQHDLVQERRQARIV